jgi:hypothetical protein
MAFLSWKNKSVENPCGAKAVTQISLRDIVEGSVGGI